MGLYHPNKSSNTKSFTKECFFHQEEGSAIAFFDGAASSDKLTCGAGGVIKIRENLVYRWYLNVGTGSNTKAELMGIWATLTLAIHLNIRRLQALGDSKVIIDWLKGKAKLDVCYLEGWKKRTKRTLQILSELKFLSYIQGV
jgi:ribonuclease HI